MNRYKEIYKQSSSKSSALDVNVAIDSITSWEDGYWLFKIISAGQYNVSDEKLIDTLERCFFMGLSNTNKVEFFDANENLSKLYIRYGMYSEASSKLMVLAYNYDCPDWVHLYLAMTQLHTTFERIVEEPKFFFERLLKVDLNNIESKKELLSVFGNYLCLIAEQPPKCAIASDEIIKFAKKIGFTSSDEFKQFHQTICPEKEYIETKCTSGKVPEAEEKLSKAEYSAKQKAAELETELTKAKNAEETAQKHILAQNSEIEKLKGETDALRNEKTALAERLKILEAAKQTAMQPSSIDDVFLKMNTWLNVPLRRYLAQWLTDKLSQTCKTDFWNKKVKKSLSKKELDKFDSYKELTDFAIDALLNIYYCNLDDFYSFNSLAKTNDREHIQEMQQIRNRWVGHFEENSWTKEKILFDIDTILEFVEQIEMPMARKKEYIEFRVAVSKMS